jgi:hypothetical protein
MGQIWTKKAQSGLLQTVSLLPKFSTGCGNSALKNSPTLGTENPARSQVGDCAGYPLIHRYYYHYYYSYLLKYMWRKE